MKTQNEIALELIKSRHISNWYLDKPYKSLGSVLHWLYVYTILDIAETAMVGGQSTSGAIVKYRSEPFAHIYWNDELQMPIFVFLEHKPTNSYWKKEGTHLQYLYLKDLLHDSNSL